MLIAGATGPTARAVETTELAARLGYDFVLLSGYGTGDFTEQELLDRTRAVAEVLPVIGFYLQPAVGGRPLSTDYWRSLADLEGVAGIKIAPFDRYATLDVMRGVAGSSRRQEIALYTGNDDTIVTDLVSSFGAVDREGVRVDLRFVGAYSASGPCGPRRPWSCWRWRARHTQVTLMRWLKQWPFPRRSPTRTAPSSTPETRFAASSRVCTKSCADTVCWKGRGCSMSRRCSPRPAGGDRSDLGGVPESSRR